MNPLEGCPPYSLIRRACLELMRRTSAAFMGGDRALFMREYNELRSLQRNVRKIAELN